MSIASSFSDGDEACQSFNAVSALSATNGPAIIMTRTTSKTELDDFRNEINTDTSKAKNIQANMDINLSKKDHMISSFLCYLLFSLSYLKFLHYLFSTEKPTSLKWII